MNISGCKGRLLFRSLVIVMMTVAMTGCQNKKDNMNKNSSKNMENNDKMVCQIAVDSITQVGEGAIWDYKYNRLLWIDTQGSVFIYTPDDGKNREIKLNKLVGTVIPYQEDAVIVALQDGIYELNLKTEALTFMADPEGGIPGNKYNDGKCDAKGRLWVGTMDNECTPKKAGFYLVDGKGRKETILKDVTISNGVAWSLDGKTMYYQDTPLRKVLAFDFDEEKGVISNRREILPMPDGLGDPDGNTIDEEGMLWIANWGAACVTRWNPKTGEMLCKIDVPGLNVASLAFGGKNLDELYITTASLYMPEDKAPDYPEAGKLFVVKPGVKGVKCNYFVK